MADAIRTNTPLLIAAVQNLMSAVIDAGKQILDASIGGFSDLGQKIMNSGFVKGLKDKADGVKDAVKGAIKKAKDAVGEKADEFLSVGKNMMQGLIKGIKEKFQDVVDAAKGVVSGAVDKVKGFLGIHSPSKVFEAIANFCGLGAQKGAKESTPGVTDSFKGMAQGAVDGISGVVEKGKSKLQGLTDSFTKGTELDYSNMFGDLLGKQEDANDKADKNEKTAIKNTGKNLQTHRGLIKKNNGDEIVDYKTYMKMLKLDQDLYWKERLRVLQNGADKEKYIHKSLQDYEKEVFSSTTEIWKKYCDEFSQKTDSMMDSVGLFDAVKKDSADQDAVTAESLIQNIKDQAAEYQEFNNIITSLNGKITDKKLLEEINSMGIDSINQLKAMNSMTSGQLTEFEGYFKTKYSNAANIASVQMTKAKEDTVSQLNALFGTTGLTLDQFQKLFDGTFKSITELIQVVLAEAPAFVEAAKANGVNVATGLAVGINSATPAVDTASRNMIDVGKNAAADESDSHSPSRVFRDEVGRYIPLGVAEGIDANVGSIDTSSRGMIDTSLAAVQGKEGSFTTSGQNITSNLLTGLSARSGEVGTVISSAIDGASTNLSGNSGKFLAFGQSIMSNLVSGLSAGSALIPTTVTGLISGMVTNLKASSSSFLLAGQAMMTNLSLGIQTGMLLIPVAMTAQITSLVASINLSDLLFNTAGQNLIINLSAGITLQWEVLTEAFTAMLTSLVLLFDITNVQFMLAGQTLLTLLTTGISVGSPLAVAAVNLLIQSCIVTINAQVPAWYSAGQNSVNGFTQGINSKIDEAVSAAASLAKASLEAAMSAIGVHSPSTAFARVGMFADLGFANGLTDYAGTVSDASASMATGALSAVSNAVNNISDSINSNIDSQPVIKPVLDLSDVESGAGRISQLFNENQSVALSNAVLSNTAAPSGEIQNGANSNYVFNQYNYSPTALSRLDIYRQTKNQFAMVKGLVTS